MKIKPLAMAVALLALLAGGCVSATYDPETGKVHYLRVGSTKMDGLVVVTPAGTSIELAGYGSEGEGLARGIAEGVTRAIAPSPNWPTGNTK